MPRGKKNLKAPSRMAKRKINKLFAFRAAIIAFALIVCGAFGVSVSVTQAQIWSEPTQSPPNGNTAAPIWNQNASDQTANFRISGTGTFGTRVGIGTSSPIAPLDIYNSTITNGAILSIRGNFHTAGNYGMIRFGDYTQTTQYQKGAIIYEGVAGSGRGKMHLALNNTDDGTSVALTDARLTVLSNGNIGIGVTSPKTKLDVYGNSSDGISGANAHVIIEGSATNALHLGTTLSSPFGAYIQVGDRNDPQGYQYPLLLNPIGGNVGIGTRNPVYKLDVNGVINAANGAQGFGTTSYGIYGASTSGAGVGGVSTSGYGVYGSSSSSYAGYFNGPLNATGAITQNGVDVCLENGTNCPVASAGSDAAPLQYTRGLVATNATLATKDSQCVSEFGANYRAASIGTIAAYYSGRAYTGTYTDALNYRNGTKATLGLDSKANSRVETYGGYYSSMTNGSGSTSSTYTGGGIQETVYPTSVTDTYPVICEYKANQLIFTRAVTAVNSTLATKDAQCTNELGSQYRTASLLDITSRINTENSPYSGSWTSDITYTNGSSITIGLDSKTNARISNYGGYSSSMTGGGGSSSTTYTGSGLQETVYTTSLTETYPVACIKFVQ